MVSAASLEGAMCHFFEEKDISWSSLISIILYIYIEKWCQTLLDVDGDSCHHIHNAAKRFAEPFGRYLEQLFTDLHTDHQWASDQVMRQYNFI